jgi:hypothetical protein
MATVCQSMFLMAHDSHELQKNARHWHVHGQTQDIEGTFCFSKDGFIYIEDASHQLHSVPFSSLSETDRQYVKDRIAGIKIINHVFGDKSAFNQNPYPNSLDESGPPWLSTSILILISILLVVFIIFRYRRNTSQAMPLVIFLCVISLSAFAPRFFQLPQAPTNPATIDSAFAPFVPQVHTFYNSNYFYVESKGIPTTHTMMVGISNHGWQQQVPIPQCYIGNNAWPIPLNPVLSANPIPVDSIHFTRGAIAIAVNGVPIFNYHTNTGVDSYLDGQLDNYGGHCGRADDYHYHIAPLHLYNYTTVNLPIAYGLDGFPVFGATEPDGSAMLPLDANHGHMGSNGVYHYHGTNTAPYMIGRMAGQVTEDASHQLVPQPAASPVRPALTPLNGALITSCTPNANNNGYNLTYSLNTLIDSVVYSWTTNGIYTFKYYKNGNLDSTRTFNGFNQCTVPTGVLDESPADGINIGPIYFDPSNHALIIKIKNSIDLQSIRNIQLYDIEGQLIHQTNSYVEKINVPENARGIYLVRVNTQNQAFVRKVLIH